MRFTLLILFLPSIALAQTIAGVAVEPSVGRIGESLRFTVSVGAAKSAWCGVSVAFGDGEATDLRMESSSASVNHVYRAAGTYAVRVEGKGLLRGLKSVMSCEGAAQSFVVTILDPVVEKEKALAAEREQAKKAEFEARERELRLREQELQERERTEKTKTEKARELVRKQEIENRERALKAREDELAKKEREAKKKDVPEKASNPADKTKPVTLAKPKDPLEAFK